MNKLQEYITDYLRYLSIEKDSSPLTVREYKRYLKEFSEWLAINYPDFSIDKLDMPTIRAFRSYLAEKVNRRGGNLAKVTQSHYIICIRSFLKFLLKNDIKTLEPSKIELPKTNSRSPKFLDKMQLEKLIAVIDINEDYGLRDRTIVELFLSTGLRVNELFKLDRDSVNLQTKEFVVIGKGRKARLVFLSDTACEWISKYLATRKDNWKPLFIRYSRETNDNGEKMRLSVSSIERMIKSYGAYAGIELKMTPHVLRHSFATDLMINGADLRSVQELLGHTNISTTQIYTHVTNSQLREVHKKFHRV